MKPTLDRDGRLMCECNQALLGVRRFGSPDGYGDNKWALLYCPHCVKYWALAEIPEPGEKVRAELDELRETLRRISG